MTTEKVAERVVLDWWIETAPYCQVDATYRDMLSDRITAALLAEREACAKVADAEVARIRAHLHRDPGDVEGIASRYTAVGIAAAIRARQP